MVHLKVVRRVVIVSAVVSAFCVGESLVLAEEPQKKFYLYPVGMNLVVGEQGTFHAMEAPTEKTKRAVVWTSSEPDKFSVDENGTVTAHAAVNTIPPPYVMATDSSGSIVRYGYVVVYEPEETKNIK